MWFRTNKAGLEWKIARVVVGKKTEAAKEWICINDNLNLEEYQSGYCY